MDIKIRKAMPRDADFVASLIYAAAPQKYDYWLGSDAHDKEDKKVTLNTLSDAFENNAGVQGYEFSWVATHDDAIVGVGACYQPKNAKAEQMTLLKWAQRYYGTLKLPKFIKRGLELSKLQQPINENVFYAANLGVTQSYWGQGIATCLIDCFENMAREQGQNICLDVAVSNQRAKVLYEYLGYQAIRTSRFTGKASAGVPDSIRMIKTLTE